MNSRIVEIGAVVACLLRVLSPALKAEDWPTYQHDNRRSAVTGERLALPLQKAWEYVANEYPQPAWAGAAKWDSYAGISNLRSMRDFDPVFHITAAQGCVFFGSSADDAVHCLDIVTGREKWVYFTDGPVRLPPSFNAGKLYFGSDDGCIYCIRSESGELVWWYEVSPGAAKAPADGKLISLSPCRTGAIVQNGKVYFAASMLPWQKTYLCALNAESGTLGGPGLYKKEYQNMTAEGPMLASATRLYVPQGRQTPLVFDAAGGSTVQTVGSSGFGGVFGLLTEDSMFVHGHGQNHRSDGELRFFGAEKADLIVTFPRASSIVIHDGVVYLHADGQLQAFDRVRYLDLQTQINALQARIQQLQEQKKKLPADAESQRRQFDAEIAAAQAEIPTLQAKLPDCFLWRVANDCPLSLILAGDTLFAGGDGKVAAYETAAGGQIWSAPVEGRAHGLAAANGSLLVSTDLGRIICFAAL
jgi:hypothetical protein